MIGTDKLKEYREKRDFRRTGEPAGAAGRPEQEPVFVVQQHDASRMHWDFRLQIGGVLVSWAVPKGPSTDPGKRRLAVRTEDHPLEYARFEGRIPDGQYGAGVVIVWDAGTFDNVSEKDGERLLAAEALDAGHVTVRLHGEKLAGGYSLIHAKMGGEDKNWLLVKVDDEYADARKNPVSTQPRSVVSGRTLAEVAGEENRRPGG